jgi:rhodanese-related sulfurtransferase
MHTPGHRPEHCAFVVDERIALTGDSLLVGDAARPDLAIAAREGATALHHSLGRLLALGDDVEVFPGHVAGSLCGTNLSADHSSTIGRERASNGALAFRDVQEFVLATAAVATPRPPTTDRVVALNRGPWLPRPGEPQQLADAGGATVLDVRDLADHAAGHLPGALSVPLRGGSFATKAAFVLEPDERIVLHAASEPDALEAARRLWAVGILELAGYVLAPAGPETLPTVDARELAALVEHGDVDVIDVRETYERDDGYIPGSRNIPYRLLRTLAPETLDRARPIVTVCESGARAGIAASVLEREGYDVRAVTGGGIDDFDGELVSFRRCGS